MKFETGAEIIFYQVRSDGEIKGTFYGPTAEVDALNKSLDISKATGSHVEIYRYSQKATVLAP